MSYLTENCPACLIMLTVEKDSFFELSDAKGKIIAVNTEHISATWELNLS